jgi:hypothetical protein
MELFDFEFNTKFHLTYLTYNKINPKSTLLLDSSQTYILSSYIFEDVRVRRRHRMSGVRTPLTILKAHYTLGEGMKFVYTTITSKIL